MTIKPGRYLAAHFAKSQLWHASDLLFAFFLTETCGLNAAAMGWVLGTSLLLNGAADLAVGALLTRSRADVAAAIRLQAWAVVPVAGCFLLFAATPLLPFGWRLPWALAALGGFRLFYPSVDVAQNALVPMVAGEPAAQRRLLGARNIVSAAASLVVALVAAPLLIGGDGVRGYILWSAIIGGLAWWAASRFAARPGMVAGRTVAPVAGPVHPRRFGVVLAALVVMLAAATLFRTMEPYFAAFASGRLDLLIWSSPGAILAQPIWLALTRRHGMPAALLAIAAALLFAALLIAGAWRGTGVGGAVIGLVYGLGSSGLWLILWSQASERAAAGRPLWYMGAFTCAAKLSQGAALLVVGQVLAASHYSLTLADPASPPSLAMTIALVAMAGVALALAGYEWALGRAYGCDFR